MIGDSVFELRQYTLRGGQRDMLITLFEHEFIEPQDELGAHVHGTFRDLDDPDRFVWLRGFANMPARQRALEAFYGGPVWQAHRSAANATMIDSDNVLLLRPVAGTAAEEAAPRTAAATGGIFTCTIHYLGATDPNQFRECFREVIAPRLTGFGVRFLAQFDTDRTTNTFPRLPVREREPVYAWLARWANEAEQRVFAGRWAALSGWRDAVPESVLPALMRKAEVLRLSPTARSLMQ